MGLCWASLAANCLDVLASQEAVPRRSYALGPEPRCLPVDYKKEVLIMQPYPLGSAPSSPLPRPSTTNQQIDKFLERWWVATPGQLRRYSVYLSETWADGIYLTAWPWVATLAPLLLLLFGFLEGATHWSLLINDPAIAPGEVPLTFTQLLPLIVLTAAVSAFSTNLGLVLVLGYALGDFLIAGFRLTYAQDFAYASTSTLDPTQSFLYLHLA